MLDRVCEFCNSEFTPGKHNAKFCSKTCRGRARLARRKRDPAYKAKRREWTNARRQRPEVKKKRRQEGKKYQARHNELQRKNAHEPDEWQERLRKKNVYRRDWYRRNAEREARRLRKYRAAHREQFRQYAHSQYWRNPQKLRDREKVRNQRNREQRILGELMQIQHYLQQAKGTDHARSK